MEPKQTKRNKTNNYNKSKIVAIRFQVKLHLQCDQTQAKSTPKLRQIPAPNHAKL